MGEEEEEEEFFNHYKNDLERHAHTEEGFIGSLKAGFVTERSELASCRAFRVQYHIFKLKLWAGVYE